jgi:endonuclease G, mitochondrial
MYFAALFLPLALALATPALADCPAAPLGVPVVNGIETVEICHTGYLSLLDPKAKESRVVTYGLTAAHSHAHGSRKGMTFKLDALAPPEDQGRSADYRKSGYDLGHMAPAEDFAWSRTLERETFSMANVEPQLPGLNRQGWERIEEITRAEACRHGAVVIFTGPVFPGSLTISADRLPVPQGFFKLVIDPATGWALAFMVPQAALTKGQAADQTFAIETVIGATGIVFPLPDNVDVLKATAPDDRVLTDYRAGRCKAKD